jgi:hypothetical protein
MPHLPGEPPLPLDLLQLGQPRWKCELAFRQAGFNANEAANFIFANMHRGEAWWASAGQAQGTTQGAFGGTAWAVNLVPPATPVVTTPAVVAADPVAMAGAPLRTPPAEPPTSAGALESTDFDKWRDTCAWELQAEPSSRDELAASFLRIAAGDAAAAAAAAALSKAAGPGLCASVQTGEGHAAVLP